MEERGVNGGRRSKWRKDGDGGRRSIRRNDGDGGAMETTEE